MTKVFWTDGATAKRNAAIEHIARDNLETALKQLGQVMTQTERLVRFPQLGRPGQLKGTRELSITRTRFVVVYRIIGENIQIMRFLHTSQKR